jgi:iron complex outermembrane recepter protein
MLAQGSVALPDAVFFIRRSMKLPRKSVLSDISILSGKGISLAARTGALALISAASYAQTQLPAVSVSAPRLPSASVQSSVGGISDAPLAETPQSISIVGSDQLKFSGALDLSTALRGETSVANAYNTFGYIESFTVRGFLLNSFLNYRRDGLAISNHAPINLENKEALQILKGVSGIQAGVSAPGGLINYVLKKPTTTPTRSLGAQISERGTVRVDADFGGRTDDRAFGYRIIGALQERRPAPDNAKGDKQFLSGFFDYRFRHQGVLEWEVEHSRSKQISVPGYGLLDTDGDGVGDTLPKVPSPRSNQNAQAWSRPFESASTTASIRYEQPIALDWKAGIRLAGQRIRTNDRIAFPDGCSSAATYVYPGLCANGDVDVYDFRSDNERRTLNASEAYLKGDAKTGFIKHELNVSLKATTYRERYEPRQAYNYVGTFNAFAPTALPADGTKSDLNTQSNFHMTELSITDAMQLNEAWSLWWGLKHTRIGSDSSRTDGSRPVNFNSSFTTPYASLGYKPWKDGYAYVSGGQGIETESVPNRPSIYTNFGQALPALKSKQLELGFKQVIRNASSAPGLFTAAVFSIEKPFSDDVPAAGGLVTRNAGARLAKHQGLELSYAGALSSSIDTRLQATFLDAKQKRDAAGLFTDKRTTNVSPFSAAATVDWQIVGNTRWSNRLTYFSSKPVNRDNSVSLPAAWQFDTALRLVQKTAGTTFIWQAGIDNVFNRRYWQDAPTQSWGGTYLFAAQPRTLRASVTANF